MLGQSIYVSRFDESFIPEKNIDFYFTSMHIAEEFNDEFKNKALKLLKVLNEYNKKIILDISPRGVEALGFKDVYELLDNIHIDVLRLDFGFSEEEILNICDHITIGINASTNDYSLAQKIKEVAKEHHVEIVENKPLARMLYHNVEIGEMIPPELYQAVAEVLAMVYHMQGRL